MPDPANRKFMTLRDLARMGEQNLTAAGVPDARHDAMALLLDSFGITKADYALHGETDLIGTAPGTAPSFVKDVAEALEKYREGIRRRSERVPLQQILGTAPFMGFDFMVDENVLIPRMDTEVLVEAVMSDLNHRNGTVRKGDLIPDESAEMGPDETPAITCLDLCTGSGCIGISLAALSGMDVTLSDISEKALTVARENADRLAPQCRVVKSDLFENIPETFDVIVSNPPYIRDGVIETLDPEVRVFEPWTALSGGTDGLEIYRRIAAEAPEHLAKGGRLYLEIGFDQAEDVSRLLEENGFSDVKVTKDYCGNDRVVSAIKD